MNIQEIYDKAVAGLIAQKFVRSIKSAGTDFCMYRNPDGLKCAIGHCIPDDIYDRNFESIGRSEIFAKIFDNYTQNDYNILCYLQKCHDSGATQLSMAQNLKLFGEHNKLIIPETLTKAIEKLDAEYRKLA